MFYKKILTIVFLVFVPCSVLSQNVDTLSVAQRAFQSQIEFERWSPVVDSLLIELEAKGLRVSLSRLMTWKQGVELLASLRDSNLALANKKILVEAGDKFETKIHLLLGRIIYVDYDAGIDSTLSFINESVAKLVALETEAERRERVITENEIFISNAGLLLERMILIEKSHSGLPIYEVSDEDWEVITGMFVEKSDEIIRYFLGQMVPPGKIKIVVWQGGNWWASGTIYVSSEQSLEKMLAYIKS